MSVLVVAPREETGDRNDPSLYLSKALVDRHDARRSRPKSTSRGRGMTPANLDKRAVVILNDTPFPPALAGGALKKFVEQGGGLLVVLGEHTHLAAERRGAAARHARRAPSIVPTAAAARSASSITAIRCSKCSRRRAAATSRARACSATGR